MDKHRHSAPMIRPLNPGAFGAAANVLAVSFAEESLFKHLLGADAEDRARRLTGLMRGMIRGHAPCSDVDGAFVGERLVGVSIAIRPDRFPLNLGAKLSIAGNVLLPTLLLALRKPRFLRLLAAVSALEKHHPKEGCYYLAFFGVHPAARKGGVAVELSRSILARADAQNVGCYLDTAGRATMRMCRLLGFEVLHELRPIPDGPTCWGMWRSPRSGATDSFGPVAS